MWFGKKKDRKNKIDLKRKFGSFAFFFSIPVASLLAYLCVITLHKLILTVPPDWPRWGLFIMGIVIGFVVFAGTGWQRTKTFIHEMKHAVLVLLTGNKLTKFSSGKNEGSVEYQVYKDNIHFEPFVLLAPYFLPLLSFPLLLVAMLAEPDYLELFAFLIGFALGLDGICAWQELHPGQSDLKRIFGGFLVTRAFILVSNLLWISICLLWIVAGNLGYVSLIEQSVNFAEQLFTEDQTQSGQTSLETDTLAPRFL